MKSDIQIAQENQMEEITSIAQKINMESEDLSCYGKYKAKVSNRVFEKNKEKKDGKLILVTAINPTKAGEGKSTVTIGLVDGLASLNQSVMGCLREPSMGPVFGMKGGATGGGYTQIVPMEDINLHFTGDMHAITAANNLIAAMLDNHLYQGNKLNIDPEKIVWKRCLDMNDRSLREITIAQNKKSNGIERKDSFCITVATEVMATLCLARDREDFKKRIGRCVIAYSIDGNPITVDDLGVSGAVEVIMKDALEPNLVQTLEKNPVFVHGGPFANIAHGCNSVIATKTALKLVDYVVTEAGFGSDLGAEKFLDIKCRLADIQPTAVVLVATIRALKMHGGESENALSKGIENLEKHIESISEYKLPCVVALNKFEGDTEDEVNLVARWCQSKSVPFSVTEGWSKGGLGVQDLARKVINLCAVPNEFQYIYDLDWSIEKKIEKIVTAVYGGKRVIFSEEAQRDIKLMEKWNWDKLPICMAKTPMSLSDDPTKIGRPRDFEVRVQRLKVSAGAGFVIAYTGNIMTMPGLPCEPAALKIGICDSGKIQGLF
ncbi:MAG: formate--tetrahydrofolate ligase [Anaerorhabdus sp.]